MHLISIEGQSKKVIQAHFLILQNDKQIKTLITFVLKLRPQTTKKFYLFLRIGIFHCRQTRRKAFQTKRRFKNSTMHDYCACHIKPLIFRLSDSKRTAFYIKGLKKRWHPEVWMQTHRNRFLCMESRESEVETENRKLWRIQILLSHKPRGGLCVGSWIKMRRKRGCVEKR